MAISPTGSLSEALGVRPGDVVALTGGGGKTAALYRLGEELAALGYPVLLGGTTRFTPPERGDAPQLTMLPPDGDRDPPLDGPWPRTIATGHGDKGRLLPVTAAWVDALHARRPELTIILEADGSSMRPFKAPAAHEPVIPSSATLVTPVVGLDILGRPLDDVHVHRAAIAAALAGVAAGMPVDEAIVAAVISHPDGGRKELPAGARWVPLLNKCDSDERFERARRLAALLAPGAERVAVSRLRPRPYGFWALTGGS